VNGQKRGSVYGKTFTECLTNLHKVLAENGSGAINFDAGDLTVGEFIGRWLEDSVKGTVREVTFSTSSTFACTSSRASGA
jgi:integrase